MLAEERQADAEARQVYETRILDPGTRNTIPETRYPEPGILNTRSAWYTRNLETADRNMGPDTRNPIHDVLHNISY